MRSLGSLSTISDGGRGLEQRCAPEQEAQGAVGEFGGPQRARSMPRWRSCNSKSPSLSATEMVAPSNASATARARSPVAHLDDGLQGARPGRCRHRKSTGVRVPTCGPAGRRRGVDAEVRRRSASRAADHAPHPIPAVRSRIRRGHCAVGRQRSGQLGETAAGFVGHIGIITLSPDQGGRRAQPGDPRTRPPV